jgi:hypothetical protein
MYSICTYCVHPHIVRELSACHYIVLHRYLIKYSGEPLSIVYIDGSMLVALTRGYFSRNMTLRRYGLGNARISPHRTTY